MSRAGDVYENPVTGERVMVGVGNEGSGGELSISDFYLSPGAVAGEHLHPNIELRSALPESSINHNPRKHGSLRISLEARRYQVAIARNESSPRVRLPPPRKGAKRGLGPVQGG
jgi:hypothetical protein